MDVYLGLIGLVVSLLSGVFAHLWKDQTLRRSKHQAERARAVAEEFKAIHFDLPTVSISTLTDQYKISWAEFSKQLTEAMQEQMVERVAEIQGLTRDQIRQELERQLSEFRERIAKIENRFPDETNIEKIASINDALLAERIDQISKRLDGLDKRILTKWDVALTVSMILGGIFAVVTATYSVISFFGGIKP